MAIPQPSAVILYSGFRTTRNPLVLLFIPIGPIFAQLAEDLKGSSAGILLS
jgi:hypothetical protein